MAYTRLGGLLLSHPAWIFFATLFIFVFSQWETSLFGLIPNEPLQGFLAFAPFSPWREWGLTLFSYPLIHQSFEHWVMNAFMWLFFSTRLSKAIGIKSYAAEFVLLMLYALLNILIAITFLFPFAPSYTEHDRILGLSATIFFQLGFLLCVKKRSFLWIFLIALAISYGYFGAGSLLAMWGHASGFTIGILIGIFYRFRMDSTSNETF